MRRFELTDAQWEQIAPLLPPQKPRTGRPAEDHRQVLDGMLWILRTGAPWEDLPARYGPVGTVSSRFLPLAQGRRVRPGAAAPAGTGGCPRRTRLGSALCGRHGGARPPARRRARRSGAIGREGTVEGVGEALGRSQGGFSTKLHLRAEGGGKPITAVLTAASATSSSRWMQ